MRSFVLDPVSYREFSSLTYNFSNVVCAIGDYQPSESRSEASVALWCATIRLEMKRPTKDSIYLKVCSAVNHLTLPAMLLAALGNDRSMPSNVGYTVLLCYLNHG